MSTLGVVNYDRQIHFQKDTDEAAEDVLTISRSDAEKLEFPEWAPTWEKKDDHAFEDVKSFKHIDRGLNGDPTFKSLKDVEGVTFQKVSPKLGLVVDGLQLSKLTNQQKDDLALLVEQRGVIAFRNQDFKHESFEKIKEWGKYYGPLHVHPTSGAPLNHPEFHLVFRRGGENEQSKIFGDKLNNIGWHSDVSYENQPPGITAFAMLQTGESGGDTQFLDMFEIYDRLSPLMKDKIDDLKVLHTSKDQAYYAGLAGGIERKEPSNSIHPLVRYHPVLKRKSLFINKGFSRKILGLKTEESDNLIFFLLNHIESCLDAHVRLNWDADTVVVWDNRRVLHTATNDWSSEEIRHAFRVTTIAERPVNSEEEYENWTPEKEAEEINLTSHYVSLPAAEYYEKYIAKHK
jgi:alpha-ketoglutarate-dependent taurine dioxygenase